MRVQSPLSNLSETINQIKESAAQYRDTLQRNEAATRAVLIDPILQALGWDTANIYMVLAEKSQELMRVDYALYDRNRSVRFVIEAKSLGANLDDTSIKKSIFTYAHTYETNQIFLTDGLIWKHVTIGEPGNIAIYPINFAADNVVDCAAYLVQHLDAARFWPEEQTIDELVQRVSQLESDLTTLQKEISQLRESKIDNRVPAETALVSSLSPPTLLSSSIAKDTDFVDLASIGDATNTSPSQLRLPDGTIIKVRRWKDVLRECCKFALSNNPNIRIPLPDSRGKTVNLFDTVKPRSKVTY